jgi:hypothetical protein
VGEVADQVPAEPWQWDITGARGGWTAPSTSDPNPNDTAQLVEVLQAKLDDLCRRQPTTQSQRDRHAELTSLSPRGGPREQELDITQCGEVAGPAVRGGERRDPSPLLGQSSPSQACEL